MSEDLRTARAVSVIYWTLERGGTIQEALARASEREPSLSPSEIEQCLDCAQGKLRFRDYYSQLCDEYDEALATGDEETLKRLDKIRNLPNIQTLIKRCGS